MLYCLGIRKLVRMLQLMNRIRHLFPLQRFTLFLLVIVLTATAISQVFFHKSCFSSMGTTKSFANSLKTKNKTFSSSVIEVTTLRQNQSYFGDVGNNNFQISDLKLSTREKSVTEGIDGKSGFGIVYFLYGDKSALGIYLKEILQSADTYWRAEPNISIALITIDSTLIHEHNHHFSHIVQIPAKMNHSGRQWLTRIEALSLTPFMTTLSVDSDTFACTKFSDELKRAELSVDYDYAFAGHHEHHNETILIDAGVMLMRWTPGSKRLLREWAELHKKKMDQAKSDDQVSLVLTLLMINERNISVKVARLHNSYGLRWHGAKGEGWINRRFEHTLVVHGEVRIIHMRAMYPSYRDICDIINEKTLPTRPRLFTVDRKVHSGLWGKLSAAQLRAGFKLAFSSRECAHQLNGTECKDMDWCPQNVLTPLDDMLRPVTPCGEWY